MSSDTCFRALRAFAKALAGYLKANARRTVEISLITGQKNVKVSERALFRYHDPTTGFSMISSALGIIVSRGKWISRLGWGISVIDGETYFIIPLSHLKKMLEMKEDEILELLINSGVCDKD